MKKHWQYWAFLFGIGAILLSGCTPKESSLTPTSSDKTATQTLTIGTMPAPDSLPLYVAAQEGYFKDAGLNVKLQNFKSPKDRDAAISAGKLDGAVTDAVAFTTYVKGGLGWKIGTALTGYFGIVSHDASLTPTKLAGKTVAIMPRQAPEFYLQNVLTGVDLPANAMKIQEVPQIPVRLQLVTNKQVDTTVLPDPFLTMAQQAGLHVIAKSDPANFESTLLAFSKTYSTSKKAAIRKRFMTAYNKAVKKINAGDAKTFKSILEKDLAYPEKVVDATTLPHYQKAHKVPDAMLGHAFNYAYQQHILQQEVDPEAYALKVTAN